MNKLRHLLLVLFALQPAVDVLAVEDAETKIIEAVQVFSRTKDEAEIKQKTLFNLMKGETSFALLKLLTSVRADYLTKDQQFALLGTMINVFAASGDRDSIIEALASRPIPHPEIFATTEERLAQKFGIDAIDLFFEAFRLAQDAECKSAISGHLRNVFYGLLDNDANDDKFIARASAWFKKNKSHLDLGSYANINLQETKRPLVKFKKAQPQRNYKKKES